VALALAAIVTLLVASPILPAASVAPVHSPPVDSSLLAGAFSSSVYSGSFAARAGYSSQYLGAVSGTSPASGTQLAVVSFYPSSPSFFVPPPPGSAPLTVAQIAESYGLTPSAYASAEAYFEAKGLSVVHENPTRLSLTVSGTAAALGHAFGTLLVTGPYQGRRVMFPESAPTLPSGLMAEVSSVVGLSSGFDQFSFPEGLSDLTRTSTSVTSAQTPDLITPSIARQIYDLSSLYNVSGSARFATGGQVALVLWGDGYAPNDLSSFFANDYPSSFPQPVIRYYTVDGAPAPSAAAPSDPSNAPQELTLDMEWSGSMAPGATLDAVYAPDGPSSQGYSPTEASITDAFTKAVTGIPGVSVVSMSFGSPENTSQSLEAAWTTDFATATREGITLLAATGDFGGDFQSGCAGGPSVEFPAIFSDVIAVGGTNPTLARNLLGQVTGLASEAAWSGSGGGFSASETAPSWQLVGSAAQEIQANGDHRGVPDVSAAATYNYLYYKGQSGVAAGTSFATPLWAGLVLEMNSLYGSPLGLLTPRLYAIGAAQEAGADPIGIADVGSGSTCIGSAAPGWDPETGWGSPRAVLLYEDLTATFVNLSLTATPSPVAPGGSVSLFAHLSNRTSGAPITGVSVSLSLRASVNTGPCSGNWGSMLLTTNASGDVRLDVPVPDCYLGGHGTATATVSTDGYYGTNSSTIAVNLIGLFPGLAGIQTYPENVVGFALIMAAAAAIGYVIGRPRRRRRAVSAPRGAAGPSQGVQDAAAAPASAPGGAGPPTSTTAPTGAAPPAPSAPRPPSPPAP